MESVRWTIKGRKLFLVMYFTTFFTLYLGLINDFPLGEYLQKLKFVYIAYGIIRIAFYTRRFNKIIGTIMLGLLGYVLSFGLIFRNPRVEGAINTHLYLMLIYLVMLYITYSEVRTFRCYTDFLKATYLSLSLFLMIAFLLNWRQLVLNPLYIVKVLVWDLRVRHGFGISGTSNYTGAFCFAALMVSVLYFISLRVSGKKILSDRFSWYVIPMDLLIYLMFGSASSRSPLVSMLVFLAVYTLFLLKDYIKKYWPFLIMLGAVVFWILVASGFFDYVWANSNRVMNVSLNKAAFQKVGNIWIGMGFVDNSIFMSTSGFPWGVYTSSLDMNYVYLYYTTGLIGTVWMGGILLAMMVLILKKRRKKYFPAMISLYISLLFYAYWETVLFSYRFWPFMILYCILWLFIDGSVCDETTTVKALTRRTVHITGSAKNC